MKRLIPVLALIAILAVGLLIRLGGSSGAPDAPSAAERKALSGAEPGAAGSERTASTPAEGTKAEPSVEPTQEAVGRPAAELRRIPWGETAGSRTALKELGGALSFNTSEYGTTIADGAFEILLERPDVERGEPRLRWALDEITVGGLRLARGGPALPEARAGDRLVVFDRGSVEERYRLDAESVEQSFVIRSLPEARGAIRVAGAVTTNLDAPSEGAAGPRLAFTRDGRETLAFSKAIAIDAQGRRLDLDLSWSGGALAMTVPAEWVAEAKLPILIDPIIGGVITVDTTVNEAQSLVNSQTMRLADASWSATSNTYLVVWHERNGASSFNYDVFGQRLDATGNAVGNVLSIATEALEGEYEAAVSWSAPDNRWLVVWRHDPSDTPVAVTDQRINGRVVNADGTFLGADFTVGDTANLQDFDPSVAGDGTDWLVTYTSVVSASNHNILAQRVSSGGTLQGATVTLDNASDMATRSSVGYASPVYLVAWEKGTTSSRGISCLKVTTSGTIPAPITTVEASNANPQNPDVSSGGTQFLVAWRRTNNSNVRARRVNADTTNTITFPAATFGVQTSGTPQENVRVAWATTESAWLVTYSDSSTGSWDVYGNKVSSTGTVSARNAIANTSGKEWRPEVAYNATTNEVLTVYLKNATAPYQVQASRWGMGTQPSAPTGLAAVPGDQQVSLTWNAVSGATSYKVKRATTTGGPYTEVQTVSTPSWVNTGLTNGTAYFFVVSAVNAAGGGESTNSSQVSATPNTPPAAPTNLVATPGNAQVGLTWSAVSGATSYTAKRATSPGGPYTNAQTGITGTTFTDTGRTNGTTYYYVVSATKSGVEGPDSSQVSGTPMAPPAAPTNLQATGGNQQVTLTWTASANSTAYNVKRHNGSSYVTVAPGVTGTSHVDGGRTNGVLYSYVVSATNVGGESANSTSASATPIFVPPVPGGLTATAGTGRVTLAWTVSAGATSYTVRRLSADGTTSTVVASGVTLLTWPDTTVTNGTGYVYRVTAVAGATESAPAGPVGATPIGIATALKTFPSSGAVTVTWFPAAGAQTHVLLRGLASGGPFSEVATNLNGQIHTDTGLANGTTYWYVVRGSNPTGQGDATASMSATPVAVTVAPGAPVIVSGTRKLTLSWGPVAGAASYTVKRSETSGGPYAVVGTGLVSPAFADTGVVNGTGYWYVVTSVNAGGESAPSPQATAVPVAAPSTLTAVGGAAQVLLSWPAAAGAATYTVRRSQTSGGPYADVATGISGLTHTDPSLTNGTIYYYVVVGVNANGESVPTPQAPATPNAVPTAPTGLTAQSADCRIILGWTPVSAANVTYSVKRSLVPGGPYATLVQGYQGTAYDDQGLTNGTPYYYVVSASNAGGESPNSSELQATPAVPAPPATPNPPDVLSATATSISWRWYGVPNATAFRLHDAAETLIFGPAELPPPGTLPGFVALSHVETGLQENTIYTRHVHAINSGGQSPPSSTRSWCTLVHTPTISEFSLAPGASGGVDVTAVPPPNPTLGVTGFWIERSSNGVNFSNVGMTQGVYTWNDPSALPNTLYYYRIKYRNQESYYSPASPMRAIPVQPPPTAAPAAPLTFSALLTGNTLNYSWDEAVDATGYVVHSDGEAVRASVGAGIVTATDTSFPENTFLTLHVHATNAVGTSPASNAVSVGTPIRPTTASDLSLTVLSSSRIRITARVPANPTVNVTGVQFERLIAGDTWTIIRGYANTYEYEDPGLQPSTAYSFRIRYRSYNEAVTAPSPSLSATTLGPPPAAPGNFRASSVALGSITWAWDDVAGETGYSIHGPDEAVVGSAATGATSFPEIGLAENAVAVRHVHGMAGVEAGAPSLSVTAYTRLHDPGLADFSIRVLSPTRIEVAVATPANGTAGLTGCEIQRSPDGAAWTTVMAFSPMYRFTHDGLAPESQNHYRIRFRNGDGVETAWSPSASAATSLPPAPAGLAGVGVGLNTIRWTWTDVSGEVGYELHAAGHVLKGASTSDLVSIDEVVTGENVTVGRHVHAANGLGTGPESATASAATPVHAPTALDFKPRGISSTEIVVSVVPPPNPTAGYTGVEVERSNDGVAWSLLQGFAANYTVSDPGRTTLQTYHYRIRFQNADGTPTAWSPSTPALATASPVLSTPSKKIRIANVALAGTTVSGSDVRVFANGVEHGTAQVVGTAWTYTANGMSEATHAFTAKIRSGGLYSDASPAAQIQVDLTAPAPATNVRTTSFATCVDVEWDPSPSSDTTGYRVYRKIGTGGTWTELNPGKVVPGTKFRDGNVSIGQTYFYRVTAVDGALPN